MNCALHLSMLAEIPRHVVPYRHSARIGVNYSTAKMVSLRKSVMTVGRCHFVTARHLPRVELHPSSAKRVSPLADKTVSRLPAELHRAQHPWRKGTTNNSRKGTHDQVALGPGPLNTAQPTRTWLYDGSLRMRNSFIQEGRNGLKVILCETSHLSPLQPILLV